MADYQKRKDEAMQEVEKQSGAYSEKRNQANTQYIKDTNAAYDSSGKAYSEKVQSEIGALPEKYRPQYDANAVQELVSRRQVAEAMANYGLTDSGLNRSQQTAISLQRGNADYGTRRKQAEEQRTLEQTIRDYLADIGIQKAQLAAQSNLQTQKDILSNYYSLLSSGMQNAASLYGADLDAETAAARLAEEKQQAAAKLAEQQRQFNTEQAYKNSQLNRNTALQAAEYLAKAGASDTVLRQFLIDTGVFGGTAGAGNNQEAAQQGTSAQVNAAFKKASDAMISTAEKPAEEATQSIINAGQQAANGNARVYGPQQADLSAALNNFKQKTSESAAASSGAQPPNMTKDDVIRLHERLYTNPLIASGAKTKAIQQSILNLYNAGSIDDQTATELMRYYNL